MIRVVYDRSEWWAGWIAAQLGFQPSGPHYAIGFEDDGRPRGAVLFSDYTGENVEITVVGLWTKMVFRVLGDYCFNHLKVKRVTARTHVNKKKVSSVISRAGFCAEGLMRRYYPDGGDAVIFGMLEEECRWRTPPSDGGQTADSRSALAESRAAL
jgi:RimJ/RimL family protein N-acetyltransferase